MKKWWKKIVKRIRLEYWKCILLEWEDDPYNDEVWTKEHGILNKEAAYDYIVRKIEELSKP